MKRIALLLALLLAFSGCAVSPPPTPTDAPALQIVAVTYPVRLFAEAVTAGVPGLSVGQMITAPVSCVHNYTLTVSDMKKLEGADVLLLSGAGLEDFMADPLATTTAAVIDCAAGLDLLPAAGHEDHDHHGDEGGPHFDPHLWLDPERAAGMVLNLAEGLSALDPEHADQYRQNAAQTAADYRAGADAMHTQLSDLSCRELITFHDGFGYFAEAFSLTVLRSIEEEAGSEASAREVGELIALVRAHKLPAIFTEVNGGTATAQAIARETGCGVFPLSTLLSPPDEGGPSDYLSLMQANVDAIALALGGAP